VAKGTNFIPSLTIPSLKHPSLKGIKGILFLRLKVLILFLRLLVFPDQEALPA